MPEANLSSSALGDRAQALLLVPFLVVVVLAPLPLGGYRPVAWSINAVAAALLLLAWIVLTLRGAARPPVGIARFAVPLLLFVGIAAWIALQALAGLSQQWSAPIWEETARRLPLPFDVGPVSVHPDGGVESLLRFLAHGTIFFLAAQLGRSRRRAERIFTVLLYAGAAYAAYGLVMLLGGFNMLLWWERWAYVDSVTATFVNRNHYATFAGLTLLCGIALLSRASFHGGAAGLVHRVLERVGDLLERHWGVLLALCVVFASLVLSNSRAGLGATIAAVLLLVAVLARTTGDGRSMRLSMIIAATLVALMLAVMGGKTLSRLGELTLSSESRDELFRLSLTALSDSPWVGYGAGSFADVIQLYLDRSLASNVQWAHAHNSYLEFAVELGVPALLALLVLFAWLAGRCVVGVVTRRRDRLYPATGIAAMVLVGLHALVDFSIQLPGVAIPFAALIGVAYAQSWPTRRRGSGRRRTGGVSETEVD